MTETARQYVVFHSDLQVMEVDFSNLAFEVPSFVHEVYDHVEAALAETGQKWFFLVNYQDCVIEPQAWIAFAYRGKRVNLAYSLGSVRFAVPEETGEAILESARQKKFDPNLFSSRDEALAHIARLRGEIPEAEYDTRLVPTPPADVRTASDRIFFHPALDVMEVDYSDYTFATSADVNEFYDETSRQITETGKKWYFIVNYENTEILPDAWYTWAARGRKLNTEWSLGTVRFGPQEGTREEIERRSRADNFNPNLVTSREDAFARVEELKCA